MYDPTLSSPAFPPDSLATVSDRLRFWRSSSTAALQQLLNRLLRKGSLHLGKRYHLSRSELLSYQTWLLPRILPAIQSSESHFEHQSELARWFGDWCESCLHGWMLERIADHDPQATGALYRFLYAEVLPGFRKLVKRQGGNRAMADDLFQEAFLVLIKKIQQTEFEAQSPHNLSAYVAGISKNLLIGSRRKKSYRMRVDGEPQEHISKTHSVEEDWIQQEHSKNIQAQIQRLGKVCQDILIRFFYEEKSHQEIAAELGKTAKSVRNQQYRCMKRLRAACEGIFDLLT